MNFFLYVLPWAISLARWSIFIFIKALPAAVCPRRNTPVAGRSKALADATIVVPTLDPEEDLFVEAYRSWDGSGVGEILIVAPRRAVPALRRTIDATGPRTPYRVIPEPSKGKRAALLHGAREARTELVVYVDDDTLFRSRTLRAIVDAFADPTVGAASVGQRVSPRDPARYTYTEIVCDLRLEMRYVEVAGVGALANGYCSCLSGRCSAYRRSVLMRPAFAASFLDEHFLGALQLSGDDKFLTRFVCAQPDFAMTTDASEEARVETRFKDGYALVKQLVRWSRNSWRSDLKSLTSPVLWHEATVLQFHLLDRMVTPFFVLLGPVLVLYSAFATGDALFLLGWCVWVTLTRAAKALPYFLRHPSHVRGMPLYMLYCYGSILLKFYALGTLRNTSWLTRNVTTRDGRVVARKDDDDDPRSGGGGGETKEAAVGHVALDLDDSQPAGSSRPTTTSPRRGAGTGAGAGAGADGRLVVVAPEVAPAIEMVPMGGDVGDDGEEKTPSPGEDVCDEGDGGSGDAGGSG